MSAFLSLISSKVLCPEKKEKNNKTRQDNLSVGQMSRFLLSSERCALKTKKREVSDSKNSSNFRRLAFCESYTRTLSKGEGEKEGKKKKERKGDIYSQVQGFHPS